jgi:hypothetical protein
MSSTAVAAYSDRGRVSSACGKTKDATGRRKYCSDVKDIITRFYHHEYCHKPMHQRLRVDDRVWKCCKCDLDNQIRNQCDNCNHPCCQYRSQGRLWSSCSSSSSGGSYRSMSAIPKSPCVTSESLSQGRSQPTGSSSPSGGAHQSLNAQRKKPRLGLVEAAFPPPGCG